jgi:hypothetical protein
LTITILLFEAAAAADSTLKIRLSSNPRIKDVWGLSRTLRPKKYTWVIQVLNDSFGSPPPAKKTYLVES